MIKGIFFDFDGVITLEKQGTPPTIAYIAKATGLPTEAVGNAYRRHNRALLMGQVTHPDMWQQFCEELETEIDYDILKGAFLNITLDQAVVGYIRELKEKYLIGMITDNKVDRIETILKEKGLEELFDVVVISAQVHSGKTEEKIFEEALKRSNLKPQECVFIDNTAQNLEVPVGMGFRTIYFDDEKRDLTELREILKEKKGCGGVGMFGDIKGGESTCQELTLVNYCHPDCVPMMNIMRLPEEEAYAKAYEMAAQHPETTAFYRFADFANYYPMRMKQDAFLYQRFKELGGKPEEEHPLSFVVQGSDYLKDWFANGIETRLLLKDVDPCHISFTVGDSGYDFKQKGSVELLTVDDLYQRIAEHGDFETFLKATGRGYVEVQLWSDEYVK